MARKPSRKTLVKNLDKITAKIIKLRDDSRCQRCNSFTSGCGSHWAHVYSRRRFSMRWDLINAICLCAGCHRWAHGNPLAFTEWFKREFPARYYYLRAKRLEKIRPIKDAELAERLEEKKQKLKNLLLEKEK